MRLFAIASLVLPLALGCSSSSMRAKEGGTGGSGGGTASGGAAPSAASSGSGTDAGPTACPSLPPPSPDAGTPGAAPLYPDPKLADVGAFVAQVKTACVDTSALPSHAKLDALVPGLLAEAGLTSATAGDCACEWTLAFGPAPSLSGDAMKTFAAGGTNPELYAEVTGADATLRARTQLHATTERGGLYALRAALATAHGPAGSVLVPESSIVDFPDIAARGFIDGIYHQIGGGDGTFNGWPSAFTPATRSEILRLLGRLRGNTFIYGPKCDSYGRGGACAGQGTTPNWSTAYAKNFGQASSVITLAADADANLVDLYWAINPLAGVDWNNPTGTVLTQVKAKIDEVRAMGVHHFAMFIDDANPVPTSAQNAAALMNATNAYLKTVDPSDHLLVVTWAYSGYWSAGSQQAFGAALDGDIEVMWTGPGIESCTLGKTDMTGPDANYKRTLSIWDNWPSSTCDPPSQSITAKMTGRSADLGSAIHGYYMNPVLSEAGGSLSSELAHLGPVLDFAWSPAHYDAGIDASYSRWQKLMPAWQAIVHPCSNTNCTVNGSVYIGFACDPSDPHGILFCDTYDNKCVTKLQCPKGCTVQDNVMDTCN